MTFHRFEQVLLREARFEIEQRVERVEFEEVAMWFAGRWTWAVVTQMRPAVQPLLHTTGQLCRLGSILGKSGCGRR